MKVFIPVTDEMLQGQNSVDGTFVPFNLDYLQVRKRSDREGMMPPNWISDNDYSAACKRLAESRSNDRSNPATPHTPS